MPFEQELSFLVIGERTNANGSKRFRDAMLAGDWETTVTMARDQAREGAHLLDVCVDYTGADGVPDMTEVAQRFATQSSIPLVIDTTEAPVAEAALQWIGGRAVLNSVNLEEGDAPGTRLDRFLSLARDYGAAVVCTCIDTEGQARTADWKLRAARAIHDLAVGAMASRPPTCSSTLSLCPVDGHGGKPTRRRRDDRGDQEDQGRVARGPHGPRPLERLVRSFTRRPATAQFGVPARVRSSRTRCRHRARREDPAPAQDRCLRP